MSKQTEAAQAILKKLPREELGFFPTPLHKLERLSQKLGVNLYIKRDDLTGASLFGGNKIRKLEYLLGDAKAKGCDTIFTFGATQSNHAMQTAWACRRLGLKPILYLVAIVEPDENDIRANMLLDRILGAEVHIVKMMDGETEGEAEERSFVMAKEHMKQLEAEGHRCYEVPMGGASDVGSVGFINGYIELQEQLEKLGLKADYIFHGTGTGGTMAGLVAGRKLMQRVVQIKAQSSAQSDRQLITHSSPRIISINVSAKDKNYPIKSAALANASLKAIGAERTMVTPEDIHTDLHYYKPGYEIPNEGTYDAICTLAREEGLFVDPVYTGKAFYGMLDYIRTGKVAPGSTVVFWHTGGATALFAEKEILGDLLNR